MRIRDLPNKHFDRILTEINYDIDLLYVTPCIYTRNLILNHLRDRVSMIKSITNDTNQTMLPKPHPLPTQTIVAPVANPPASLQQPSQVAQQPKFTLQELSKYDGKDGNPAYVAVNGTVYDVTNNAAWAAATHFGLKAGKDLT